jgi:hypothetical protein
VRPLSLTLDGLSSEGQDSGACSGVGC